MENKIEKQQKRKFIQQLIDNVGKKNYEKLKSSKPEGEYGNFREFLHNREEIDKIIKQTQDRKANIYKNKTIPMEYTGKYIREVYPNAKASKYGTLGVTNRNYNPPHTKFLKPILSVPVSAMRNTVGHELGHAKAGIDLNNKIERLRKRYKNNPDKAQKKIDKLNDKHAKTSEVKADKNISKYLKQIGIPKNERRAHYYQHKKIGQEDNITNNRYGGKLGNLKYLKDYLFGFSYLPEQYYLYKPLSTEWKQSMREHFIDMLRSK